MSRKEFIKNHYHKTWSSKNSSESEDTYYSFVFNLIDQLKIESAFEFAIGDGIPFAQKLASQIQVRGIDLSKELVESANKISNVHAEVGDAEEFNSSKYDLTYCLRSFWYFEEWKKVLGNMINSSSKYVLFDVLNGDNKEVIFDEINFRHTLKGKCYVATKNLVKSILNLIYRKKRYFMQPLEPLEKYHLHNQIIEFVHNSKLDIEIEFYGIVTQELNIIDNNKDYRIIYKLTKQGI